MGIALAESADGMLLLRIPRALAERKLIESLHGAAEVDDNTVTIRLPDTLVADLVLAASSRVSVDNHGDHFTIVRASGVRTHQHVSRYIHVALMRTNASAVARYPSQASDCWLRIPMSLLGFTESPAATRCDPEVGLDRCRM